MWIPLLLGVGLVAWVVQHNRARSEPTAAVVLPHPTVQQEVARWYRLEFLHQWGDLGTYAVVEVPGVAPFTPTLITQKMTQIEASQVMDDLALPTMPGWFLAVVGPSGMLVNSRGRAPSS